MSVFASQTKTTIAVPHDPPQTVTIRKLTGREVEQAQEADAIGLATGGSRTWATRMKRLASTGDPKAMDLLADPLIGFDRFAIIRAGLIGWSYPASVRPIVAKAAVDAKDGQPPAPAVEAYDAIGDLDDETADFIATEILRLTKPGLFQSAADREEARKNGSGSSIAT